MPAARRFHARAEADIAQWRACLKATGSEYKCLRQYIPQQLVKGMYAGFLPAWLEVWPRKQMMLLRTEDYKAAPEQHVEAVARFLGEEFGCLHALLVYQLACFFKWLKDLLKAGACSSMLELAVNYCQA